MVGGLSTTAPPGKPASHSSDAVTRCFHSLNTGCKGSFLGCFLRRISLTLGPSEGSRPVIGSHLDWYRWGFRGQRTLPASQPSQVTTDLGGRSLPVCISSPSVTGGPTSAFYFALMEPQRAWGPGWGAGPCPPGETSPNNDASRWRGKLRALGSPRESSRRGLQGRLLGGGGVHTET